MEPKTLFAYLDDEGAAGAVLDSATAIGAASRSHIIGMAVTVNYPVYADLAAGIPVNVLNDMNAPARDLVSRLKKAFDQKMEGYGGTFEWRNPAAFYADAADLVLYHSRACDLILCAKESVSELNGTGAMPVDSLVLEAGRPVLIIPKEQPFAPPQRVLIAWNSTREAARAVFDALPLLRGATEARILTFLDDDGDRDSANLSASQLAQALKRHAIEAKTELEYVTGNAASTALLNRLADDASDLLVMGCYGRSRFRELVFGGMSRDVLSFVTVPTLMSH